MKLQTFKKYIKIGAVVLLIVLAFFAGRVGKTAKQPEVNVSEHENAGVQNWTCSMHPQIKLPKPGKCPICFMELIPLNANQGSDNASDQATLVLSKNARALAGIVTAPVVRRGVYSDVAMSGKIAFDDTRVETISSRVSGRIDKLFANLTGINVRQGDHLAQVYSPELLSLQQELLSAAKTMNELPASASELVRSNAGQILTSTKEKMRILGFSQAEVEGILERNGVSDHMTIRAGQQGMIIDKYINEGDYINIGSPMFRIADLRTVWVMLDAYESDLAWLRLGQNVEFIVEAFAGEVFTGTISLIDPVVDPLTRTIKIRVVANNKDQKLKPDMFVKARAKAQVSQSGKIKNGSLRGKWISPMHPQIVKDGPGNCDICGMPLVPAESLGYVTSGYENVNPLVIPATAPLLTGERAVVYVEVSNDSAGSTYEGREIVLGPRVNDYYVVKSGVSEGEKLVVNGAFRIDSELQIRAKPSMMSPKGGTASSGHAAHNHGAADQQTNNVPVSQITENQVSSAFAESMTGLFDAYFQATDALAKDDFKAANTAFNNIDKARESVVSGTGKPYEVWIAASEVLSKDLEHKNHIETLTDARLLLEKLSTQIITLYRHYGTKTGEERFIAFCPMAFDNKGAYWLQREKLISNPYFGASMLRCGEIRK